jgi:hypothetical protein
MKLGGNMNKRQKAVFSFRLAFTVIAVVIDAIAYTQMFMSSNMADALSRARFIVVVNGIFIILLLQWASEKEYAEYKERNSKPVLRIKGYGNENKDITWAPGQNQTHYDTLFIDVYNKKRNRDATKVWADIQWLNKAGDVVLRHGGRWHIATETMRNTPTKENLQFHNIDSNQHPERLYFAFRDRLSRNGSFYGLYRDMDGMDSWLDRSKPLEPGQYTVRVMLQGNDEVQQKFEYAIERNLSGLSIVEALTPESQIDSQL